jgi:hypothetical protein
METGSMLKRFFFFLLLALLTACNSRTETPTMIVALVADGRERSIQQQTPITVGELLRQENIQLGALDDVNPPLFTQIRDGMRVEVVRVEETSECVQQEIPFRTQRVLNEGLSPGEERLGQAGQNGTEQVCYRISIRNGQRTDPVEISRTTIRDPQDEVILVGPTGELDPVSITGTLAYVSSGNVWIMRGSSVSKRPLTSTGDVDERVLRLSPDGLSLLFARFAPESERANFFNRLWLINDTSRDTPPIQLVPQNVLYADWVPGEQDTISYATGEPRVAAPGWQAKNDLWFMRVDRTTGDSLSLRPIVRESAGGLYGWWGTDYQWSPDGTRLAWVRADSMGLVNTSTGELSPLLTYPVFNTYQPWSWRATVSWLQDSSLILTTVHGQPIGSELADTSPAFHVAVTDPGGTFSAEVARNAGIWAMPQYSPLITEGDQQIGYIAYLKARDLSNSISSAAEYDLMIADRDGSNARAIFPPPGRVGLSANAAITWSPNGHQVAFIYQGNLWVIDVVSGVAHQLTLDGAASKPVWSR